MALPTITELLEGDLFELLGIEGADQAVKDEVLQTMLTTIDARVANRVAAELGEDGSAKFEELSAAGDTQALSDFLAKKDIDLPKIVSEEATRHRVEIIELARLATQK